MRLLYLSDQQGEETGRGAGEAGGLCEESGQGQDQAGPGEGAAPVEDEAEDEKMYGGGKSLSQLLRPN